MDHFNTTAASDGQDGIHSQGGDGSQLLRTAAAGAAKLTVKVADTEGNSRTYSPALHVPAPRSENVPGPIGGW